MKIAIIGSGGVGGYFGARLSQAGHDVTFIARGAHLEAMRKHGLQIKSELGDFTLDHVRATPYIADASESELIILGVKAWQIKEIRGILKETLKTGATVLPLQNGILASQELIEVIDRQNVLGGLCRIISLIESPGVIHHSGVTPTIIFGELDNTVTDRLTEIKSAFDSAGIKSQISHDIEADLWKKFIAICVSGLLAVTRTTYGELLALKETRQMMTDLLHEIYGLSKVKGINIEPEFVTKTISFIETYPPDSVSSLTRDVWDGKPSEIEYQNGTVVRLAGDYQLDVPVNRFVYWSILPMELKARKL